MKRKMLCITSVLLILALLFTGCAGNTSGSDDTTVTTSPTASVTNGASNSTGSSENNGNSGTSSTTVTGTPVDNVSVSANDPEIVHATDAETLATTISGDFTISGDSTGISVNGSEYTITKEGDYTISGVLNGNIIISAPEDAKVTLILNNVSISCSTSAPIYIENADSVTIKAEEGSYNVISDLRPAKDTDTEESTPATGAGAITAKCDLTVSGEGALVVSSTYNNGIHTSKDLKIKKLTLKVTALNNALKGKDSVEIKSGELLLISTGGDGIKTEDSDVSSSGKQRGTIEISGGTIDIYAACDGITASYDVVISDDTVLNIYTASYSNYSGSLATSGGSDMYIVVSSSVYKTDTDYYAYYYNDDRSAGVWKKATYSTMLNSGRTRYYGLKFTAPSGYSNVAFFTFSTGATPDLNNYASMGGDGTINTSMNAYLIKTVTSGKLTGDWTTVTLNSNSGGNSNKTTYSSKGIKADNSVTIDGGTIYIYCKDDGIHTNSDVTLENGSTGNGTVTINGGSIIITAADDGIHADTELTINGGYIHVISSYEGFEGNLITITGGYSIIYASDDGINACSGTTTPCITVTGGYVDVTTPSGDTDGIDSNGYYKQSGGFVLIKGGSSQGSVAGSLDTDKEVTVTGGTIIAFGGICETPASSVNGYVASGQSFTAATYSLTDSLGNTILSVTLPSTYSSMWVASELLTTGNSYTFSGSSGSTNITWTQTSGVMNANSAGGSGGWGGQGGWGGGGRK